jgi:hypothetical protein
MTAQDRKTGSVDPSVGEVDSEPAMVPESGKPFAARASETGPGWLREFGEFLIHNKKWWLTPIILMLILMGLLIALAGTPAAPFIYTLW